MSAKTTTESKFDELVKDIIAPLFKEKGFQKKRYNFYKAFDTFGWLFNIQKSVYFSKDHIEFTFNCSIFIPEVYQKYFTVTRKIPKYPVESECHIRERIGKLMSHHDSWYELDENTDFEKLKSKINKDITEYIFPFFEKLNTRESIIDHMLQEESRNFLLFYLLLKHRDKASAARFLQEEYAGTKNEYYKKHLEEIAQENHISLN